MHLTLSYGPMSHWVPPRMMPPRLSFNTDLTSSVNARTITYLSTYLLQLLKTILKCSIVFLTTYHLFWSLCTFLLGNSFLPTYLLQVAETTLPQSAVMYINYLPLENSASFPSYLPTCWSC